MKTKQKMLGVGVGVLEMDLEIHPTDPCLSSQSSAYSIETEVEGAGESSSSGSGVEEDPMVIDSDIQDQEMMSPGEVTPSEYLSALENEDHEGSLDEGDSSSSDSDSSSSEWEDVEEDDCILFLEECPSQPIIASTNCHLFFPKDCQMPAQDAFLSHNNGKKIPGGNHMSEDSPSSSTSTMCPSKLIGKVGLKINGLVCGSVSQFNPCWISTKITMSSKKSQHPSPKKSCRGNGKRVHFNDAQLTNIFEFEDDEESKQVRRLYWEIFAIDRGRFKDRIAKTKDAIGHIFEKGYRDRIYNERILPHQLNEDNEISMESSDKRPHTSSSPSSSSSQDSMTEKSDPNLAQQNQQHQSRSRHRGRRRRNRKKPKSSGTT